MTQVTTVSGIDLSHTKAVYFSVGKVGDARACRWPSLKG
jgi:hypothetical protein